MERLPRIGDIVRDPHGLLDGCFYGLLVLNVEVTYNTKPTAGYWTISLFDIDDGTICKKQLTKYVLWSWELIAEAEE